MKFQFSLETGDFPLVQVYVRDVTFILNKEDFVLGLRIFYIMDFESDRNCMMHQK